jgi:hypothetical protein
MMSARILGIGTTLVCGEGRETLEASLRTGRADLPSDITTGRLSEFVSPERCRRLDPLSRMALLSTCLGLKDAGLSLESVRNAPTGIIFGTGLGPQASTFSFLDGIHDFGDSLVSSLAFTNSVHSTTASQVSIILGIRGPARTVTAFGYTTGAALQTALTWIRNDDVRHVVLILGEESSEVLQFVIRRMGGEADRIRAFSPGCSYRSRGGSVALILGKDGDGYGRIASLDMNLTGEEAAAKLATCDMLFCAADGKPDEYDLYSELRRRAPASAAYSPLYGSFMTGMAVELAIAALSLRAGTVFPVPGPADDEGLKGPAARLPGFASAAVAGVCGPNRVTLAMLEK